MVVDKQPRCGIVNHRHGAAPVTLTQAKLIADKYTSTRSAYTKADFLEARTLIARTNIGRKTQKAWDRLDRRLAALDRAIAEAA